MGKLSEDCLGAVVHLKKGVCRGRAVFHMTVQHKTTLSLEFCSVAKTLYWQNSADIQYISNICS